MTFFVITLSYRESLISVLVAEWPQTSISTIEQLAKNEYTIGTRGKLLCGELRKSTNSWVQELGNTCEESIKTGLLQKAAKEPKFAAADGKAYIEYKMRELFTNE